MAAGVIESYANNYRLLCEPNRASKTFPGKGPALPDSKLVTSASESSGSGPEAIWQEKKKEWGVK